jgi:hypothetical protein
MTSLGPLNLKGTEIIPRMPDSRMHATDRVRRACEDAEADAEGRRERGGKHRPVGCCHRELERRFVGVSRPLPSGRERRPRLHCVDDESRQLDDDGDLLDSEQQRLGLDLWQFEQRGGRGQSGVLHGIGKQYCGAAFWELERPERYALFELYSCKQRGVWRQQRRVRDHQVARQQHDHG